MNLKYEWINTLFIILPLSLCVFIIVDIAYNERIWELDTFAVKARLQALGITVAYFYLLNYIFKRVARFFIDKSKDEKKANWKEYVWVFLINFVFLNIMHTFIMFCITMAGTFKWGESALINVTGALLAFLYYIMIRNRILFKSLIEQSLQLEKVKVDQLETELKFLKSQYHPHFLFNALNTIYFQVDENNKVAKQSIEQLSDLLRYQLYDIEKEVTMEQEINYLRSYIAFQQLRMSERLMLDLYFDPQLKEQKIHPLLLQPLIENAFKYVRGDYKIKLEIKVDGNQIQSEIKNSISSSPSTANKKEKGIGIENLKRRLDLLRKGLRGYIEKVDFLTLTGECEDAVQLNTILKTQEIDLLFLDIEMPEMTGIELLSNLTNPPKVIIVSAYEQYALKGYEFNVVDYLLKPVSFDRFIKSVNKIYDLLQTEQKEKNDYIFVKSNKLLKKILFKDILYIESMENYVVIQTVSCKEVVYTTLKQLNDSLPKDVFQQTHRSYIVNLEKVTAIDGNQLTLSSYKIPVARTFRDSIFNLILNNRLIIKS